VAELILTKVLKRAKELTQKGIVLPCSEPLLFFMKNKVELSTFDNGTLDKFAQLDDFDVISALKSWLNNEDFILSSLSKMIINRDLLKIKLNSEKFSKAVLEDSIAAFSKENNISIQDANYFVFKGKIKNQAYSIEAEPIRILKKDMTVEDVVEVSDQLNLKSLSKQVTKYYICFPKQLVEN
jgi:HD superfamily phosphohydrolase